uniref:Pentatricopeptide repeat-containing protein n=1 Tax=Ananas comosus var. bracteatus TaxID=296719 RepID=A0A6V7PCI2_ANACO|nr:unnamed protein product [Ananas comosus var. bracteatus]
MEELRLPAGRSCRLPERRQKADPLPALCGADKKSDPVSANRTAVTLVDRQAHSRPINWTNISLAASLPFLPILQGAKGGEEEEKEAPKSTPHLPRPPQIHPLPSAAAASLLLLLGSSSSATTKPYHVDYPAVSSVLLRVARARLFPLLRSLLDALRLRRGPPLRDSLFASLVQHLGRARLPDDALRLFLSIPSFPCAAKAGEFEMGLRISAAMSATKHRLRPESFERLIRGLCQIGKVDDACFVLEQMEKMSDGLGAEGWAALIAAVGERNCNANLAGANGREATDTTWWVMLITIRRFNRKLIRLPKYLIPITTYSNPHLFSKSPNSKPLPRASIRSSSVPARYPFGEMPYRADFVIHTLNLFKHSVVYPNTVAALHCLSLKTNSISELSVRTTVLTAYARACDVDSSLCLFDENFARDLISWNAIINACVLNRDFRTSMVLFREMVEEFGAFNSTTLVTVLSAVSRDRNLKLGKILHGTIVKRCFDMDCFLCNALVDMYAKSGDLDSSELVFERIQSKDAASWNSMIRGSLLNKLPERADEVSLSCIISACASSKELFGFGKSIHEAAEQVFIAVSYKNVVSWNAMITGLVGNGRVNEAIYIFKEMQSTGANQPDVATLVTIIPACGEFKLLLQGKSIHGCTIRRELYPSDSSIGNSLLNMYFECCDRASADILFDAMPNRDLISWNTMISGYARNDSLRDEARVTFRELLRTGLACSLITLLAILPSCSCTQDLTFGKAIHCLKIKYGFENRVLAINALMHMYMNCDDLRASFLLLKSNISMSDIVSWNTIIVGCVQSECYKDAIEAFVFMYSSLLLNPDPITLVSTIAACGHLNLLYLVKSMHGFALKHLMVSDVKVRNALITSYSRCEDISSADSVFCMGGDKNLCSWNCMISGLVQNEEGDKALELYRHLEDFEPNEISIVGIICACSQLGDLRHGMEINGHVFRFELQKNVYISAALVDMYSKCGRLDIAVRVFENSAERSTASWNSMISAYGLHGNGRKAIELFWEMVHLGIEATKSTFIALLSACSHSGLIDEGWKYYNLMSEKFGIKPTCEHNVCVVDMLGRAGRIEEAREFVNKLCIKPEDGVWGALLSACEDYSNLEIGRSISKHLFSLEPENTGYYVTLSNLYAHHGMWMDSVEIRSNIKDRGLVKPPACSVIDVYSNV